MRGIADMARQCPLGSRAPFAPVVALLAAAFGQSGIYRPSDCGQRDGSNDEIGHDRSFRDARERGLQTWKATLSRRFGQHPDLWPIKYVPQAPLGDCPK